MVQYHINVIHSWTPKINKVINKFGRLLTSQNQKHNQYISLNKVEISSQYSDHVNPAEPYRTQKTYQYQPGFRFWVLGLGVTVLGFGLGVLGWSFGLWVWGFGFRVWGFGF